MLASFLAALNQMLADAPKHVAHETADYITDHINEARPEVIESALKGFLLATVNQNDPEALALCTLELQTSLVQQGAAATFAAVRNCLINMTGFEHARPRFNLLRTSCELTGKIQYDAGQSRSYHIALVRTAEKRPGHVWEINGFNFESISLPTPVIKSSKAVP